MLRRRHINANPETSRLRIALGVPAWLFRAGIWTVQDRLLWPVADRLRDFSDLLRWPFQSLGWRIEQSLIWPARERVAGWGYPRRIAGSTALATLAVAAATLGIVLASEGEPARERLAPATQVSLAEPQPAAKAQKAGGPTLQGAPPQFGVEDGVKIASTGSGASQSSDGTGAEQTELATEFADGEDTASAAGASSEKPVPAGPEAMKVARRFAQAFVFYEVGERPERARTIFEETATPQLADALADRPPRLPENAKVPQARVLNLVPGPSRAKAYTVSVSLLRVGATSELRLKMKRREGAWVVTDVRG